MGTFTNDSGVIIASYNGETIRFEKDGLQITSDNSKINIVSIQQNKRIARCYPAAEITSPSNNGADDLKGKLFLMLEDYGSGGGITDLQGAYDGGNVVNGADVIIDELTDSFGVGGKVLKNNTGNFVNALGKSAAEDNTGNAVNAFGEQAGQGNTGNSVNAFGEGAGQGNTGNSVNAFGEGAGRENTANDSNFFGQSAGASNTTAFGVTVFSPDSVPSYADHTAAVASLHVGNGAVLGQVYIYRNEATNAIGFVIIA